MTEHFLTRWEVVHFLRALQRVGVKVPKGFRNQLYMNQRGRSPSQRSYRRACLELLRRYDEKVTGQITVWWIEVPR